MHVVFLDAIDIDYTVDTPYAQPLGGSQSALCYLAEALAAAGDKVFVVNRTTTPGERRGVRHFSFVDDFAAAFVEPPDVLVVLNRADWGKALKPILDPRTRLVLWMQHADDQPAAASLRDPAERACYDGFAFVSEWQRARFVETLGVDPRLAGVMRNAVAPGFTNMFVDGSIGAHKAAPPVLAYTSTPFRGLDVLIEAFPALRARLPGVRLKIFSSMAVYHDPAGGDPFVPLYDRARTTEGIEHVGSLPQPALARELRAAALLAYPNTFAETSCIAVMEAMAAGCRVVTTRLGALPETTDGFARLVDPGPDYVPRFVDACVQTLSEAAGPDGEAFARRQVDRVNAACTWVARAREWQDWIAQVEPRRAAAKAA